MRIKKPQITSALVFLLFFVMSIICSVVIDEVRQHTSFISAGRGYYGKAQVVFSADNISDCDVINAVKNFQNVALYKDDDRIHMRQIYINGECSNPPLCSGRFFNSDDFSDDNISENPVVIGKNRLSEVTETDGKRLINIGGIPYTVIGVVGLDAEIQLNSIAIVKFSGTANNSTGLYKLDVFSGDENIIFSELSKEIENKYGVSIKKIVLEKAGLERIFPEISQKKLYIFVIMCLLISAVTISLEWANSLQRRIAVKRLIGCKNKNLIFEILSDYFKISFSAGVLGMLFSLFFINNFSVWTLFSVLISVLCGLIVTIPVIKKLLKVSVSEVLCE
jgi:hypothetical protein